MYPHSPVNKPEILHLAQNPFLFSWPIVLQEEGVKESEIN